MITWMLLGTQKNLDEVGGDIRQNKKTFLLIHALETANPNQKKSLQYLMKQNSADKVHQVLSIFKECGVDEWAKELKEKYLKTALQHLEDIAVMSIRKKPLAELAAYLIQRDC